MENIVAFIPIRGGSKGIPGKNIKDFCGKPLTYWTAQAADACPLVEQVYIATDSQRFKQILQEFSWRKTQIIDRSPETAVDTASTESAMLEFASTHDFRHIVLIQATSPLLTMTDLEQGINKYLTGQYDSLLSVVRKKQFIWRESPDGATPVNYDPHTRPRRQEWDGYLVENGAFYITTKERLVREKSRLSGRTGIYEMTEETSYEIDVPADWIILEELKKRQLNE